MWAVCSTKDANTIMQSGKVVSVLLADEFDHEILDWVYKSWEALHFEAGMNWHILVPSKLSVFDIPGDTKTFKNEHFSSEFSRELAQHYGISRENFPCLVFESKSGDKTNKNTFIKLENRSSAELKELMLRMAKQFRHANFDVMSEKNIDQLISEIAFVDKAPQRIGKLFGVCTNVASIAGLLALIPK